LKARQSPESVRHVLTFLERYFPKPSVRGMLCTFPPLGTPGEIVCFIVQDIFRAFAL
jgi:hypothetical protein